MTHTPLAHLARHLCTTDPSLTNANDRQLLDRALAGSDQEAFAELVRRHQRAVLAACRQVLSNPADVEDAFQATFLVLVQQAKWVKCDASLGGWLFAVAHRVAVRAVRSRARKERRETAAARPSAVVSEPTADLSWREAVTALHEVLDALPNRFRLPLILCYLDGLSRDEAAAQLGWTVGAVKAGLQRGREKLRAALSRRGVTLGAGLLAAVAGPSSTAGASPDLFAAALRVASSSAPTPILELARPAMPALTKAKFLLAPAVAGAAALCVGLFAAGMNAPPVSGGAPPVTSESRADAKPAPLPKEISGRVLGSDGKAVAGAKLYTIKTKPGGGSERAEVATSAADGTFRTTRPAREDGRIPVLLAHKDGFGVAWHEFPDTDSADAVELKLVADHAITGRVIDTEGKPVAGARVYAARIGAPKDDNLDRILDTWKVDRVGHVSMRSLRDGWDGGPKPALTGADGKFALTGCGADRIVELAVSGDGLAHKSVTVINRAKFDPGPINATAEAWRKESPSRPLLVLHGPDVQLVAERGKTVEGVILDAATKKPIAGATVSNLYTQIKTDEAGRFKLVGIAKAKQYTLWVNGPAGGGYLVRSAKAEDTEGYAPVKCEIELRQGVAVTGRVTDKATGKPVRATVVVVPIAGNKFFAEYYPGNQFVERPGYGTDAEGRFRVITVPGKLLVTVQAHESEPIGDTKLTPFRGSGPDPKHPDVFDTKIQPGYAYLSLADQSLHSISNFDHGVRIVDVPTDGKPFEVNFALDRGVTGRSTIEGPDGKPVTGATVLGLVHAPVPATLTEATATVYALDPKADPRRVIAWHAEKKLGGMATIRGDEREPVAVKLAPLADIKGKFVTADGKPVVDASVWVEPAEHIEGMRAFLNLQFGNGRRSRVTTAADGTFTVAGVMPGVEYHVRVVKGKTYFPANREAKPLSAKPETGKTFDLGTIDVGKIGDE